MFKQTATDNKRNEKEQSRLESFQVVNNLHCMSYWIAVTILSDTIYWIRYEAVYISSVRQTFE